MMKLSFTTLGCPKWTIDEIIERAAQYGFDAIDFRGLGDELDVFKLPEFTTNLEQTKQKISAAGLAVSCFSSSVQLVSEQNFDKNCKEIEEYAKLCEYFGAKYIRVFGGRFEMDREQAVQIAVRQLQQMADIASPHGVKLLIETHDAWISCDELVKIMEQVNPQQVGILWDVHHPYRMVQEDPQRTWEVLGKWIEYAHVKDSLPAPDTTLGFRYCLTGEGDVPLEQIYGLLTQNGYDGYYALEWEKKWLPDLAEPEIVFPQYVSFMRALRSGQVV